MLPNEIKPGILFVSTPHSWRGGEQQLMYLMEELSVHRWPFALVAPKNSHLARCANELGFRIFPFQKRGFMNISLGLFIKDLCRRNEFKIIHVNDSHAHGASVVASALGCKTDIVLHRRVDFPIKPNFLSKIKYNWSTIRVIICISNEVKRVLMPAIKNKEKIRVVYDGIDLNRFKNIKSGFSVRKHFNIPDEIVLVGNVAALAPHKDYPTFVNTASVALSKNPNLFFIAFGEGDLKAHIQSLIDQSGYRDKILLAGFYRNIPEILPQLDIFLFTSETEGLGTAILDAFASGIPVVATRAGGIPEIIDHGENGLLCNVKDYNCLALNTLTLIDNTNLRKKIIEKGFTTVADYSKESMALQIMNVYKAMVKTPKDISNG